MSIKTRATIEDLYKVEGKAELVNGEIVEMPPAGDGRKTHRLLRLWDASGVGCRLTERGRHQGLPRQ